MDGESFDRLSVGVHRLRDKATRRGALGLLLGGSLAAAGTLLGEDAAAKKRNKNKNRKKNNCRGFGGKCNSNRDCCFSKCRNGRCWYGGGGGGGGGGGKNCGGRKCPAGWDCCKSAGVSVCVPDNYPTCCGGNSYIPGYRCCRGGGACPFGGECCGGFNQCCQSGWKCCGNGRCCPKDWHCGNITCEYRQTAEFGSESIETMPFADPISVADEDWISVEDA
jgi:hypothetical protein